MPGSLTPAHERCAARRPRVVLYSHDTMGLGHVRRNVLVAGAIERSMDFEVDILLITGARESRLELPPSVDCLALPALRKHADGSYGARSFGFELETLIRIRSEAIRAAIAAFEPDLLVVDNVPRGAIGELDATLRDLERAGTTRCILGLRDIADAPDVLRQEWMRDSNAEVVARYYQAVWVYGDPSVYDRVTQDGLPGSRNWDVHFTGYLDQCARASNGEDFAAWLRTRLPSLDAERRYALCVVGGGEDGSELAETFARSDFECDSDGVVLAGPFLPAAALARLRDRVRERRDLHLLEFSGEPAPLLRNAERVVCMGGYNTLGEVISYNKHALVVPRVRPRVEQCIRAERFLELRLVDRLMLPSELSDDRLSSWLTSASPESTDARHRVDLSGLERIESLVRDLLPRRIEAAEFSPRLASGST